MLSLTLTLTFIAVALLSPGSLIENFKIQLESLSLTRSKLEVSHERITRITRGTERDVNLHFNLLELLVFRNYHFDLIIENHSNHGEAPRGLSPPDAILLCSL